MRLHLQQPGWAAGNTKSQPDVVAAAPDSPALAPAAPPFPASVSQHAALAGSRRVSSKQRFLGSARIPSSSPCLSQAPRSTWTSLGCSVPKPGPVAPARCPYLGAAVLGQVFHQDFPPVAQLPPHPLQPRGHLLGVQRGHLSRAQRGLRGLPRRPSRGSRSQARAPRAASPRRHLPGAPLQTRRGRSEAGEKAERPRGGEAGRTRSKGARAGEAPQPPTREGAEPGDTPSPDTPPMLRPSSPNDTCLS